MTMNTAATGEWCIWAMAVLFGIGVVLHLAGQLIERLRWRRMDREMKAALRSGVILTGKGGAE
jgi:hypothetical protein